MLDKTAIMSGMTKVLKKIYLGCILAEMICLYPVVGRTWVDTIEIIMHHCVKTISGKMLTG